MQNTLLKVGHQHVACYLTERQTHLQSNASELHHYTGIHGLEQICRGRLVDRPAVQWSFVL